MDLTRALPFFLRRTPCAFVVALAAVLTLVAGPLGAATRQIADDAALQAALRAGVAGDVLVLAPGTYGPLRLDGDRGTSPAVIRSADPARPAEIIGLEAQDFEGLELRDLHLRYRFSAGDPVHLRPFAFRDCRDLRLTHTIVTGDLARDAGPEASGFPTATGLLVEDCGDITLSHLTVSHFHRGLVAIRTADLTVAQSRFTALRSDGINVISGMDTLIEHSVFHDFMRSLASNDHSDMIQFTGPGDASPSQGIVIRHNTLHSGQGAFTQSIFLGNPLGRSEAEVRARFYRNVEIYENVIINAHLHAITVEGGAQVTIRNNTLLQNPRSIPHDPERAVWQPAIWVLPFSSDVRILDNITPAIIGPEMQSDWQVSGNILVQTTQRLQPDYFGTLFSGDVGSGPEALRALRYRVGRAVGAAALRP